MDVSFIPRALALLRDVRNTAADTALLEALPYMEGASHAAAFDLLVDRGHVPTLRALITRFHGGDTALQSSILRRFSDLHAVIRAALSSDSFDAKASAIEAIVAADDWRLSDAIADALRGTCPRTRELAVTAFRALVASYLDQPETSEKLGRGRSDSEQDDGLITSASEVIRTWELHRQPEALEAALWLGYEILPAVRRKLSERTTRIAGVIASLLADTTTPALAEFTVCALSLPELRPHAVKAISAAADSDFIAVVLRNTRLLDDPEVAKGFRWIRECRWLHQSLDQVTQLGQEATIAAVRFLTACGGSHERRVRRLSSLAVNGTESVQRAVLCALLSDTAPSATTALALLSSRGRDEVARLAARELDRRTRAEANSGTSPYTHSGAPSPVRRDPFDDTFERVATLRAEDRFRALKVCEQQGVDINARLRGKLRSASALDRHRALAIVREMKRTSAFAEQVYQSVHDGDATVRSLAVAMLADLPGPTTSRLLRTALDDTDERVQANAIEGLERLGTPDRAARLLPKLESGGNRVRATGICTLLRTGSREAGDALFEMLHHSSAKHRVSALWAIEKSGWPTALGDVEAPRTSDITRSAEGGAPLPHRRGSILLDALCRRDPDRRVRERARALLTAGRVATRSAPSEPPKTATPSRVEVEL